MYNGIGLTTPRGSGTNGYVTRNVAHVKMHKDRIDYKSEEQLKILDQAMNKGPNADILDHERKRKVEVKCLEMQELMQEQGYSEEEIESKVAMFRQMLTEKECAAERTHEIDESGRPITKDSHQVAEANKEKNDRLRAAFGISEFYEDGTAMNPNRKQREEEARNRAIAEKRYNIVRSSEEPEEQGEEKKKKKHKRHRSPSKDSSSPGRKKSKKHKKEKTRSSSGDRDANGEHKRKHKSSSSSEKKHKKKS